MNMEGSMNPMPMPMPMPMSPPEMPNNSGDMMGHNSLTHMTFFWSESTQILFSGWPGHSSHHIYYLALFLVATTAAACECLSIAARRMAASPASTAAGVRAASGLALTAIHALKMGLLYLVMLAVMSFNGGVLIAAVVGHAVGFLVAGSGAVRWVPVGLRADAENGQFVQPGTVDNKAITMK